MVEMRRKDRQLTAEEAWCIVERCSYGVMTMVDEEGQAYGVPVNHARSGDVLYIHCATEGKKTDAMGRHPRVSMVFVDQSDVVEEKYTTRYASAMVFGTAGEVTDDEEKIEGLRAICQRHAPGNMEMFDEYVRPRVGRTAVWKITVEQISGKANR